MTMTPTSFLKETCFTIISIGLVQDCSISIANALEILQSCAKPLIYQGFIGLT